MSICMWSFCMHTHKGTHKGTSVYSLTWRTFVESAQNLTVEILEWAQSLARNIKSPIDLVTMYARSCFTLAFESEYSCSAQLTLLPDSPLYILIFFHACQNWCQANVALATYTTATNSNNSKKSVQEKSKVSQDPDFCCRHFACRMDQRWNMSFFLMNS